ncbi:hypothetical protein P3553_15715 [Vibrio parahaemolyticus]|uniref:hypothetical protein n=1 Tax=Vibrio harveyi group TaxID=717610 RepID=UPI00041190FB|nr:MULTISPECIES: hypothetical protein [Vibrio harveyi group]EMB9226883.1 hypothetical protein [Vibrio alginolyticus]EJU9841467.1 hypothetical protein [Vibrio parahaemolyticus]ELB2269886.1 hypothetical protein [Vibrio parahaemolyticus]MBM5082704.1 hypothetical protein [Vibrio parahaemolyticus]MBO0170237.1 hypothetical protein [Vibrio parahaemolyticus]
MFGFLKNGIFLSKVQAELKAQYDDQYFVNTVCQHPEILEQVLAIKDEAYYRKDNAAPFITVCFVLGEVAFSDNFSAEFKQIAISLLAQRLLKVENDPQFRLRHILIFGDLEQKLSSYIENNPIEEQT